MKIGDKVRFLNEVGGGVIAGFKDKNMVMVTDETGFDIPVLRSDVVVIETDEYNLKAKPKPAAPQIKKQEPVAKTNTSQPSDDTFDEDKPITFRAKPQERRGGDLLNLFLAFLRADALQGHGEPSPNAFDAYIVNDSNYYIQFILMHSEGRACQVRYGGLLEPNTKLYLDTIKSDVLSEWEKVSIQAFAYKQERTFLPKPPVDVCLRLEGAKFYKQNTFVPTDFFQAPALVFDVVRDDKPVRSLVVDPAEIKRALFEKADTVPTHRPSQPKPKGNEPIVVDLHADELLETTAGMQSKDILDYQLKVVRETLDAHKKYRGTRIVFIHGKGNGVLRNALLREVKSHYKSATTQDASFQRYGFGATLVCL